MLNTTTIYGWLESITTQSIQEGIEQKKTMMLL